MCHRLSLAFVFGAPTPLSEQVCRSGPLPVSDSSPGVQQSSSPPQCTAALLTRLCPAALQAPVPAQGGQCVLPRVTFWLSQCASLTFESSPPTRCLMCTGQKSRPCSAGPPRSNKFGEREGRSWEGQETGRE